MHNKFVVLFVLLIVFTATGISAQSENPGELFAAESVPCPDFIVNGRAFTFNAANEPIYGVLDLGAEVEGETYSCGVVPVPENYDEPDGRSIELFYLKLHSTSQSPAPDPVVYLAGGPGSSGSYELSGNPGVLANLNAIRERRDIIAYDQRGTGFSNFLLCAPFDSAIGILQERDDNPEISATLESLQADGGLGYFALQKNLCGVVVKELAGVDVGQYNSVVSAQDIAHLTAALGYTGFYNLYGTSYGTRLAQFAMRSTPDRIRSVVIDGVTSPAVHNVTMTFASYFEPYVALFAQCEADAACTTAYPNLAERFGTLLEQLEATPLIFDPPPVLSPMYSRAFSAPTLAQISPDFFVKLASFNNISPDGGLAGSVPRMVLALEEGDTEYFVNLLGAAAPPPEAALVAGPTHEDDLQRVQADQPQFQLPFDALLVAARNEAARANPGIDTQWVSVVLDDLRARLLAGQDQAALMEDLLYLSVLPNTGTTAQILVDFANEHLSQSAADQANAVVGQMAQNDVRSTLWHIQDVAMSLGADIDDRADSTVMMLAVNCAEDTAFSSLDDSQTYLDSSPYPQLLAFPFVVNEAFLQSCIAFPTTLDESVTEPVVTDIPALLFLAQLDTQTPITWGRSVAEELNHSFVVEWNNMGHIAAVHDLRTCAGDIAAAYLDDPAREPNTECSQSDAYRLHFELPE